MTHSSSDLLAASRPPLSASSSSSSPLFLTLTLASPGTADQCVIDIPYAADRNDSGAATHAHGITPLSASAHNTLSLTQPGVSERGTSRSTPPLPSSSLQSSPTSLPQPIRDEPAPHSVSSVSSSPSTPSLLLFPSSVSSPGSVEPMTSEQRRIRRRVRHRDIDATRREKETSALAELESVVSASEKRVIQSAAVDLISSDALQSYSSRTTSATPTITAVTSGSVTTDSVRKRRKRVGGKASVMAAAAKRIVELERSLDGMLQQLEQRQMHQGLSLAYGTFFHTSPVQSVIFSLRERRCVDANDAFCRFTGYSHRQLQQSRLAFCPAQPIRLPSTPPCAATAAGWEQWEVDAAGRSVPVPLHQLQVNLENLGLLMEGRRTRVVCVFRIALAGQRLTESQCDCWLAGEPATTPGDCTNTARFIVVQTTADRYRAHSRHSALHPALSAGG